MSDLLIRTYGTAEFTTQVFNAVALTVNDPSFKIFLSGAFLIALTAAIYQFTKVKDISVIAKNIFLYVGVMSLLLVPKIKVTVQDDVVGNDYGVDNVPIGLAYPAYIITNTFHELTRVVETMLHHPDDPSYSKTGFLFASHVVRNATLIKPLSGELNNSLNSFFSQCVFYDIYLGRYAVDDLLKSDDMWSVIKDNASKNRAFMLDNEVTMCNVGVAILDKKLDMSMDNTLISYAKAILPGISAGASNQKILKEKLLTSVGSSYGYLTGVAKSGAEILKQNILINALQDSALNNPELGMYSYAVTRANVQKTVANTSTGLMMARWLPAMMGATETMIYALFILVVIYALFTNGEKVFFNYVMTMVWVGSWPVVYAILNFGFTWAIKLKSYGSGLSFYDASLLSQTQYDMPSLFGYFTILVPYIAWSMMNLAKQGLGSVFTQMSQLVGNSTQSLSQAASNEAITGNMHFGNTSFGNHSMFNTSGFKHDTNMGFQSGAISTQLASGSQLTQTASGNSVIKMQGAISDTNVDLRINDRLSIAASEQVDNTVNAAKSDHMELSNSATSVMRNLYDVGNQINTGTSIGESFNLNKSAGSSLSVAEFASAVDRFADANDMSTQDAVKYLTGAYSNLSATASWNSGKQAVGFLGRTLTGLSAGAQVTGGVKFDVDKTHNTQESKNYSKAEEFLTNNNLTNTIDKAIRGIEENSYRSDTREGQNLIDSMGTSYDQAKQASNRYSAHIQEALSYRELANYSKDNSTSINYNVNQEFVAFVASKPMHSGEGAMGPAQAEILLRTDQELQTRYAEEFIQSRISSKFNEWRSEHLNKDEVYKFSDQIKDDITSKNNIAENFDNNKKKINSLDINQEIKETNINSSLKNQVKSILSDTTKHIDSKKVEINDSVKYKKSAIKAVLEKTNQKVKDDTNN